MSSKYPSLNSHSMSVSHPLKSEWFARKKQPIRLKTETIADVLFFELRPIPGKVAEVLLLVLQNMKETCVR